MNTCRNSLVKYFDTLVRWNVALPSEYRYLRKSGCTSLPNVNDKEEFQKTAKSMIVRGRAAQPTNPLVAVAVAPAPYNPRGCIAMTASCAPPTCSLPAANLLSWQALGFTHAEMQATCRTLAAILHLGNIDVRAHVVGFFISKSDLQQRVRIVSYVSCCSHTAGACWAYDVFPLTPGSSRGTKPRRSRQAAPCP
jgi:hypothetical protein